MKTFSSWMHLFFKLISACSSRLTLRGLLQFRVLVASEHKRLFDEGFETIVDIGANRGQFSLAARRWSSNSEIFAFEPLEPPSIVFLKLFSHDPRTTLHQAAIGPRRDRLKMHVSRKDDSSSLLEITPLQIAISPGTEEVIQCEIEIGPLSDYLSSTDIKAPALLKLDVQGYEALALQGCESLIDCFDTVYCECSFVEFYAGQALAAEIIQQLADKGFYLNGLYNPATDPDSRVLQADFLFRRKLG